MTYVCLLSVPHCLWLAATIKALELYFSCMCACISYCWMHNLARLACLRMVSSSSQIVKSVCEFHDYDTISILSGWSIELLMSYILLHLIVGIYEFGNLGTKDEARGLRISWIPPMWHITISYWCRHKSAFMVFIFFFTEREGRRWGCVCSVSRCFHTQWLCQDLTLQVGCPFLCTMTLSWPYECIVSNNDLYSVCMFSSFQRLVNLQRLVYFLMLVLAQQVSRVVLDL